MKIVPAIILSSHERSRCHRSHPTLSAPGHTVEGNHINFHGEDRKISQKNCGSRPWNTFTSTDCGASGDGLWGDGGAPPGIPVAFLAGL